MISQNPLHAKVRAMRFGLSLAVDRGYNKFIIEFDFMMAVKMISKGDIVFWDGSLMIDILDIAIFYESC